MQQRDHGVTAIVEVFVTDPVLADTVTGVLAVTVLPVTMNDFVDIPAGTVTVVGVMTVAEFELRVMVVPLGPAIPTSLTVPVALFPPTIVVVERVRADNVAGVMVSAALADEVPIVPVMLAVTWLSTPEV